MSILNDLLSALFDKSQVRLAGELTIALLDGSIQVTGQFPISIDANDGNPVASLLVPFDATVEIAPMTFPIPKLQ